EDLNKLQMTGLSVPTFNGRLNFAFSVLAGDHLACNEIGGFQKNFSSGQFCRLCHVSYEQRLIPLTKISFPQRTTDEHDRLVQKVLQMNNGTILEGVADLSPLSTLIGFHAVTSLPNDIMHDFAE
ncbi:unnamed protein product, partial [Didymodactylos carnosus]